MQLKSRFIVVCLSIVLVLAGCAMGRAFTVYSIEGFESFFDFGATEDVKEECIRNKELEFAKLNDVYVCPFIKEVTHEDCGLFFYIYGEENSEATAITICDIVISDEDNKQIIYSSSEDRTIALTHTEGSMSLGIITDMKFSISDSWFIEGNTLNLSFHAVVDSETIEEKSYSYSIQIVFAKNHTILT